MLGDTFFDIVMPPPLFAFIFILLLWLISTLVAGDITLTMIGSAVLLISGVVNACDCSSRSGSVMSNRLCGALIVGAFKSVCDALCIGLTGLDYIDHFSFPFSLLQFSLLRLPS
jgi:hypothetical protein